MSYLNGKKIYHIITKVEEVEPTGKLEITDLATHDVSEYAEAQVVDSDIIASNIRQGVNILGVNGTLVEGIVPTGKLSITDLQEKDVTTYAKAQIHAPNLLSSNIKKNVNILGVVGTYEGGGGTAYSITTNVTNGTYSGATGTYPDGTGTTTTAQVTIAASSGYVLPTSVSVSGASFVYNNTTGVITLTNATGNVTITAACVANYTITNNITNGTATGDTTISTTASVTIVPNEGYDTPTTITVTGATYTYNRESGVVSLNNPTGNVTIVGECVSMSVYKGKIINIDMDGDGTNEQYRVLKLLDNDVVEVVSMNDVNSSIYFGNDQTYAGGTLDTYLNTTWYGTLSSAAKNAIVDKTFSQASWNQYGSTTPNYKGTAVGGDYAVSLVNATFGSEITRHAYALSVQDVIDYLEVTHEMTTSDTTLNYTNMFNMFWNDAVAHSGQEIILSSANSVTSNTIIVINGSYGSINATYSFQNKSARAAFQIDLSKITWS